MQKTAYEMRISDWISDVCSSDLGEGDREDFRGPRLAGVEQVRESCGEARRLARARAGEDEQRTLGGQHRLALGGVEAVQVRRIGRGGHWQTHPLTGDRKSVVEGRRLSVRVDLGGRLFITTNKNRGQPTQQTQQLLNNN